MNLCMSMDTGNNCCRATPLILDPVENNIIKIELHNGLEYFSRSIKFYPDYCFGKILTFPLNNPNFFNIKIYSSLGDYSFLHPLNYEKKKYILKKVSNPKISTVSKDILMIFTYDVSSGKPMIKVHVEGIKRKFIKEIW